MSEEQRGVSERMRSDWNQRAREDPHYYVAFGGRDQDEETFLATAADVLRLLEGELRRLAPLAPVLSRTARKRSPNMAALSKSAVDPAA